MTAYLYDVTTDDGKYRYTMDPTGIVECYRNGEPWPARTASALGDKYLLTLVQDLSNARAKIDQLLLVRGPTPAEIDQAFNATDDQLENTFTDESDGDTWERTLAARIHMLRNNHYKVVGYETRSVAYHGQEDTIYGWDIHHSLPDWVSEIDFDGKPRWEVRPVYALRSK